MTPRATTLRVIRDISFGDDYNDVILFNNVEEQTEFFMSQIGYAFEEHSYQRPEAGYFKVSRPYKDMARYCYLMFRNSSHEDKWWYAFVDEIVYINDNTTGVRFHIDIMQSYMFDYTLGESFVVREHPSTDNPGDNLVPETINFGEYEYDEAVKQLEVNASKCPFNFSGTLTAEDMCLVVAYNPAIFDLVEKCVSNSYLWKECLYGGVYQGIRFICMPFTPKMDTDAFGQLVEELDTLITNLDLLSFGGIASSYMMPIIFLPDKDNPSWENVKHGVSYDPPTGFPGYTPVNKKLLTYPYVAINATNKRGEGVDYAYEYFINRKPSFFYEGTLSLTPSCICYPVGYKGKVMAVEEGVTLDSYPLVTWGQDGFTEWVSNHMFQTVAGIGLSAATAGVSAYAGVMADPVGTNMALNPWLDYRTAKQLHRAGYDPSESAMKEYATKQGWEAAKHTAVERASGLIPMAANTPPPVQGVNAHDLLFGNLHGKSIRIRRKRIRTEYAKRIDSYFSRYGYATNEMKVPNLKSRPFWNYIQLANARLDDINCPMGAANAIKAIYERGVTFWRPDATIGDYENQRNSV